MVQNIDYSKSIFYKITCNNLAIEETYLGWTINFKKREIQHKSVCNNQNRKAYNLRVYEFIRNNGGWNNWKMSIIEEFACVDRIEVSVREKFHHDQFNKRLNSNVPGQTQKKYQETEYYKTYQKEHGKIKHICINCGGFFTNSNKSVHMKTSKHLNSL